VTTEPSEIQSSAKAKLRLEEKVQAEDLLYQGRFHTDDNRIWWIAMGAAILFHVIMVFMRFPDWGAGLQAEKKDKPVLVVRKYIPPPPKIERPKIEVKKLTRKVPIPDPTPEEPEPIREPEPEIDPTPIDPDAEILIGEPEPPPPGGPLIAGAGGVTMPELIQDSRVEPTYPEMARKARIEGNVILQAVILKDGSVGELAVLRSTGPSGIGFDESAIAAVRQWRYRPGTQNGQPVDVFLTVQVDFRLE